MLGHIRHFKVLTSIRSIPSPQYVQKHKTKDQLVYKTKNFMSGHFEEIN